MQEDKKINTVRIQQSITTLRRLSELYRKALERKTDADVQWEIMPNGPIAVLTVDGRSTVIEGSYRISQIENWVNGYLLSKSEIYLDLLRSVSSTVVICIDSAIEKVDRKIRRLEIALRFTQYVSWIKKVRSRIRNQINSVSNDLEEDGKINFISVTKLINPFILNTNENVRHQAILYTIIR